jgi:hypothetical protein
MYHAIVPGWLGAGLLDALSASGIVNAQDATTAAAGADRVGTVSAGVFIREKVGIRERIGPCRSLVKDRRRNRLQD